MGMHLFVVRSFAIIITLKCISMRTLKILQLSDIHFDPYFQEGASIYTSCHRKGFVNLKESSSKLWGDQCDSSEFLIEATLKQVSERHVDISHIILTGDNFRHDDDSEIPVSRDEIYWANTRLKSLISFYFPYAYIYFCLGNHDVLLHDCLGPGPNLDLQLLKNVWLGDEVQSNSFDRGGYWSKRISENLKIISVNTLYYSKKNTLAGSCGDLNGPGWQQLSWLKNQLFAALSDNLKVIIIGHIAPMDVLYHTDCLAGFVDILGQFPGVVSAQIYGHSHLDDISILKRSNVSVGFALTAPSIVPTYNPGYRVYYFDDVNGSLLDYHQFYTSRHHQNINYVMGYGCAKEFGAGPMDLVYFEYLLNREKFQSSVKIRRNRYRTACY
jgi:hypothetical protein